jgi:hypothetical protein
VGMAADFYLSADSIYRDGFNEDVRI